MGLFNNNQAQNDQPASRRQRLEKRYDSARAEILWILAFTVINIVLLVTQKDTYFLFSAYIPYFIADVGMYLGGKYPAEYYRDPSEFPNDTAVFAICLGVAAVICVLYLLCWLFSKKKRVGWLIAALVMFTVDTIPMLLAGFGLDNILDIALHVAILVSMTVGVVAHFQLKKLPEVEPENVELPQQESAELTEE